ncbi:Ser/Thr protein phosphatase family protein [Aspergillus varians]
MMRRKTRFVCVSDTHGYTPSEAGFRLPAGDVLIHAGDLTNQGSISELRKTMDWIAAADYEVKIVICGNHDITLSTPFCTQHHGQFHNQAAPNPEEFQALVANASPSIVFLQHQSALVRLRKPNGPNTVFKVFGSPYSQCTGEWAFLYEPDKAEELWRGIPLDSDIVVTHMPPRLHCGMGDGAVGGCEGLRGRLEMVRPGLAVCGHVHKLRGCERVRWRARATKDEHANEGEGVEDQVVKCALPPQGSKKQSLVDLTGKRAARLDNDGWWFSRAGASFKDSFGSQDVVMLPSQDPKVDQGRVMGASHPSCPAGDEAHTRYTDAGCLRAQRHETCVVNAAIMASNWPHRGGRKFHPGPIVVDLELPVWRE